MVDTDGNFLHICTNIYKQGYREEQLNSNYLMIFQIASAKTPNQL